MTQNYAISGRYSIESVSITNFDQSETLDMRFIIDGLTIEESIFAPTITGYIDVNDSTGIHLELPIFGQETINIVYSIGTDSTDNTTTYPKIKRTYYVYKMANKRENGLNGCTYRLYFCSPELITNETIRISKSYRGALISDIVTDAFSLLNSTKTLNLDTTINAQRIVVPYQTPIALISWLAPFATHAKFQAASYFFFENALGFNFKNLEELYQQNPIDTYSRVVKQTSIVDNNDKDTGIDSIQFGQMFDMLGTLGNGAFGSSLQTYDIMTRTYNTQLYNYATDFANTQHLEDGTITTAGLITANSSLISSDSCRKAILITTPQIQSAYVQAKNEDSQTYSKHREDVLQDRLAQIGQLSVINSIIEIPGDTRLTAGCIINFNVPAFGFVNTKKSPNDQYYTGKYLIKKITHQFKNTKYTMFLELAKDSVAAQRQNIQQKNNADASPVTS